MSDAPAHKTNYVRVYLVLLALFVTTDLGLALRATGSSPAALAAERRRQGGGNRPRRLTTTPSDRGMKSWLKPMLPAAPAAS